MKPSELLDWMLEIYESRRSGMIWGPPGIGKSELMYQFCEANGLQIVEERLGDKDPVDVKGLPRVENDTTYWTCPEFLKKAQKGKGVLFLDEINVAPKLVQAAAYQLVNQGRIGRHEIGKNWIVMAAGNRESDRAVVHKMPTALSSRFAHMDFDVNVEDWVAWALANDVAIEIIAFVRFRPELLHSFDPTRNERAFPCPRTWEILSDVFKVKSTIKYETAAGIIGEGAATEFIAFLDVWQNLPDIDALLMDPKNTDIGTDPAILYAVCGAVVKKATDGNMARVVKVADKLPEEFSVLLMRDVQRKDNNLTMNKAYISWVTNHQEALGLTA